MNFPTIKLVTSGLDGEIAELISLFSQTFFYNIFYDVSLFSQTFSRNIFCYFSVV